MKERYPLLVAARIGQGFRQSVQEQGAVGKSRQVVVISQVVNLLFSGFAVGYVYEGPFVEERIALQVTDHACVLHQPNRASIFSISLVFEILYFTVFFE